MTVTRQAKDVASKRWEIKRRRYERVIDQYLRECYATRSPARVSAISRKLVENRSYFSEVAGRLFGKSLKAVFREKQLARAVKLLKTTTLSIAEIGEAAGFGNKTTFHRVFKRAFGMKPAQYRRHQAKKRR
jgi:AraC-like DNA-binding protein